MPAVLALYYWNMGIIDTTKFTVTCPKCGLIEDVKVHQKGSAYNPYWQGGSEMKNFEIEWIGGGRDEPKISSAKCRSCGGKAVAT